VSGTRLDSRIDEDVAALLRSDDAAIADPYPVWGRVREEAGAFVAGPVVLLTRYDDVKRAQRDEEYFGHGGRATGTRARASRESMSGCQRDAWDEVTRFESNYLSRSEGESHLRRRRIAHRGFQHKKITELEEATERYAEEIIGACGEEGTVDLKAALAYRMPLMIICDMLGVPDEEREKIHQWSGTLARNRGGDNPEVLMAAHGALAEFRGYVDELLVGVREHRGTDLLSNILGAEEEEQLSEEELQSLFVELLFAGHETTTNLIANGLVALMDNREQWARLCEDPLLAPSAVEELLRFVSPVQWQFRLTLKEVEIDGVEIPADHTVFSVSAAGNRDPRRFEDPDSLDITREDAKSHLAFGFGPHFCIGNVLARMEGRIVLEQLSRRFPDIKLTKPSRDLRWTGNAQLRSLVELPVDLGSERP
jgi:cytochrome P450